MKKIRVAVLSALITMFAVTAGHAIVGAGIHWGFDLSMNMEDALNESVKLDFPEEIAGLIGDNDFFRVSRTNWRKSAINFGGKVWIDFLPVIDAITLSCNFGMWEYDGVLEYIDVENLMTGVDYRKVNLTLDNTGLKYIGQSGTPYAKLHFDATVTKQILNLWLIKFNAGAGVSAHFATPLLSGKIVEDILGGVEGFEPSSLSESGNPHSTAIVQKIIDEALGRSVFGGHILLGARIKLPVLPVGAYLDTKYMFPFSKFEKDAESGIKGFGLLINTGISFSI